MTIKSLSMRGIISYRLELYSPSLIIMTKIRTENSLKTSGWVLMSIQKSVMVRMFRLGSAYA